MSKSFSVIALTFGLAVGLALLRLIHLGADTPPEFSKSAGPYVDEGYKTLSPRNLVLYGTTHWNPEDKYVGWMTISPITQWSYYASFRLFGANIEAARGVTILFVALLLVGFAGAMSGRYPPGLILAGLLLIGLDSSLFFVSRIALFEIPIAAFLCGLLFVFARLKPQRPIAPVLLALAASVILVFGIKLSAALYLAPILLVSSLYFLREKRSRQELLEWRYLTLAAVALVALLLIAWDRSELILAELRTRIHLAPSDIAGRVLENPLVRSSPAIVLAGLLCAVHGLVCRPDLFLRNIYRLSLAALVLLGIPLVALFEYDPLRYYIPLLPACVLIVLEWIHLGGWKFAPRSTLLAGLATMGVLTVWFYFVIDRFGSGMTEHRFFLAVPLVLAVAAWIFRARTLQGKVVAATLLVMLPLFVVRSTRSLGSFFLAPTFQAREIRAELVDRIAEDSIIAGVWAPFIALGTNFKSLYVATGANRPEFLPELAPDYVLHTVGSENSEFMLSTIRKTRAMSIGAPLLVSKYDERIVALYPLLYNWRANASIRRGPFAIGRALARSGDPEAAEPWLRRSLLERKQLDPSDPLLIAEAQSEWGACLAQLGRHEEAEGLLREAYESYRPGGNAPAEALARLSLKRLVALYEGWNRPERSAEYRARLDGK